MNKQSEPHDVQVIVFNKMKKISLNYLIIAAFAGMAAFTGCKKDGSETAGQVAVNLKADIKQASTLKVANDQWEASDKVGLYMKRAGQALTASGAVYSNADNVQMSLSLGDLVATPEVNYPENGNVDFIAYYPYTATVGSDYSIDVNVASQSSGPPQEVLYSNNVTGQAPTTLPVTLNFLYSLAKIEITVTGGQNSPLDVADFTAMTASIEGMYTQAKLQLADGTFTGKNTIQTITLYKKGNTATSATFEALVLPTTTDDGEVTFAFHVGDITFRHVRTTNYATHNLYRLNFALDFPIAILRNTCIVPRNDENPIQNITILHPDIFEPQMVFVEGGTFTMGSPDGVGDSDEIPEHDVTLNSFHIGKYPVTQGQWVAVMGTFISQQRDKADTNASLFGVGDNYPMYYVNWDEAQEFITKLNEMTGKNYRLPTEAEWEYAARGGNRSNGYIYSGSDIAGDVAWYSGNSGSSTHPVCEKAINELGIYDMSGNVWEWCNDWHGSYSVDAQANPSGPSSGSDRVLRGGSWDYGTNNCRVANRGCNIPEYRYGNVGFRVVLP
jgi:formylglycine-generating enzyme required for sulfatase activity